MKKLLSFILVLLMCSPLALADIDLSGLTFEELAKLRDQCQYEMWQRDEWQEVTVPQGVWKVGEDIPAGTWTVRCIDTNSYIGWADITIGTTLDSTGNGIDKWYSLDWSSVRLFSPSSKMYTEGSTTVWTLTVKNGQYVEISSEACAAVFTPYTGKPSLGFK